MRTSHKHTHTQPSAWHKNIWLRLFVITLLIGAVALGAIGLRGWPAQADGLDATREKLHEAKSRYLANPTKENTAGYDKLLAEYRAALKALPAASPAAAQAGMTITELRADTFFITPKLTELPPVEPSPSALKRFNKKKNESNELPIRNYVTGGNPNDPVIQSTIPPGQKVVSNPIQNFDGPDMDGTTGLFGGARFAPNDPNADVGPNHVVVTVNSTLQVFNKMGVSLVGPIRISQIMAGLPFAANDDGDPIVLYDPLADRWLISQFQVGNTINGSTRQHIAISRTSDPTGQYFAYDFPHVPGRFGDYPHLGVWPTGYFMTTNDFNFALTAFLGATIYAYNRTKMLAGDPTASVIALSTGPADGGFLPTDIDGLVTPPVGTPNASIEFFADEFGAPSDFARIIQFSPNFDNPAASTFTTQDLTLAAFDARQPASRAVIDQPPPAVAADSLDSIADRLMHRLAYRTLSGGTQSFVMNWTVNVSGVNPVNSATYQGGVRWTELRRNPALPATTQFSVNQQATYAPGAISGATGRNLWMASVAQDGEGNIALAANASSTTLIPTAIYTGRLFGDPANTLPQGEVDALAAVTKGVQIGTGNRWGDYSSLSVDPADECTFWGAFEYVDAPTATFDWNTRVFSFKVNPTCVTPAKGTIQGQATNATTTTPIPDVSVTTPDGYFRSTDVAGNYSMTVAPGTYTVTCRKLGFASVTGTVTVAGSGTATFNCAMQPVPVINLASSTITAEDCAMDGRTDPGENISVQFCFNNIGAANTTNLVGTLQATGGVTNPSAPQSYGVVVAGGPAVCRTFSFRVNPALACGSNVVATLTLQDGASNLGTFNVTFQSGQFFLSATENFDGVTAPALPAGWTAANAAGPAPLWVTSTSMPDTPLNTAFVDDPAVVSDKRLDSALFNITASQSRLVFRNNFNLEPGFDGGVLEASVNGAAFVDVTNPAVGGTFAAGGYNGTISTAFMSPIAGRMAWTASSGGYITTDVRFGATLQGKTVRFRWRMGSDNSVAGVAWRVDTIQLFDGFSCCVKITPTVTLSDPASCTGPGNNIAGTIRVTNPSSATLTGGTITAALPAGLVGTDGCTATVGGNPVGTCTVTPSAITWTGSLAGNATLTINFIAQVGDVNNGTQLCLTTGGSFTGVSLGSVVTCVTVNCPAVGPGNIIPTIAPGDGAAPPSDQKPGSVLFYNVYTSATDPNRQNTRINLTNIEPSRPAFVHLFFVDGSTCSVADAFICLTANQTVSFLASDLDPGVTGYMVAVAVDRNGCPINFNYLIGDEYVKFSTGHQANLGAESIPAVAGSFTPCTTNEAILRFDGVNYAPIPRVLALDNVASRADGNDTLVIVNRVAGDLFTTAATIRFLFGAMYDDAETLLSFSVDPRVCQFRSSVGNSFPRTTPRFEQAVPAGRTAWFKFYSTLDQGLFGAAINFNPNSAASAGAVNGGHNLHKLTFTTSATYTIPVLPVSCQ